MDAVNIVFAIFVVAVIVVWVVAWKLRKREGPVRPGSGTADPRPGGRPKPPTT
jgi:hypothetical protein